MVSYAVRDEFRVCSSNCCQENKEKEGSERQRERGREKERERVRGMEDFGGGGLEDELGADAREASD